MFSTDAIMRRGAVVLACTFGLGGAALAQTIVVSSAGPSSRSYPAGKSLAPGAKIALAAGDTLTVLDKRGTRTLRGPGNFGAEASSTVANQSFASLVSTQNRRRARTGAVRNLVAGQRVMPPSLWFIDIERSATVCIADAAAVQLWRPDMQKAATLTVTDQSGKTGNVVFPLGQNNAAWPATMPLAEGQSYMLSGAGLAKPVRLRFAMLGLPAADPVATYTALDAKGCTDQKDLLIAATDLDKAPS
jgi:hypothetical protein